MKRILFFAFLICTFFQSKAQYVILLSPNGGETFAIGSSQSITWAALAVTEIDIEYSSDNGSTFNTIATNVSAFSTSYNWIVTGPTTSNGLIRIKESSAGLLVDVSTATFNVVNPSLQISYPTAGLIFNPGQQVTIAWTGNLVSNNVNILFSSDNGSTYDTVITNTTNFFSYDWTVPPVSSVNCKLKIIDAASALVQSVSPAFTIEALPSGGTILTPNGGEILVSTTNYDITWNSNGTSIIDLEYSSDGGSVWQTIGQNIPATPSSFSWLVPSLNSNNAKVRLKNAINGLVLDESNSVFTISQPIPSLYLSSPFGFENWAVGSTQVIQWTYSYMLNLTIEYSTDGGSTFNLISTNIPASDLSFNWTIPPSVSSNCLIRITDNNSTTTSQNQFPFSIVNPSLILNTPNGGEVFNPNVDTLISWNGSVVSNFIKLEYSTNGGTSWNLIAASIPNQNYYHWLVPNTPSTNCKVRVSDAQYPAVNDQSNASFTISPPTPVINLIAPNGGEQWGIGTYQTILWNSNNIANVKIELSNDSGITWVIIDPLVPANAGSYNWLVSGNSSLNTLIRVSDAANISVNDVSSNVFETFIPTAFVDLIFPNGGEQLATELSTIITWNSQSINSLIIEYSINNGISWQTIANNVDASLGQYNWITPNIVSNSVKIRIRDINNVAMFDQSAVYFSIIEPSIAFSSFPAGANFDLLSNLTLYWTTSGITNQPLRLEYSINNGNNWVTMAGGINNIGVYNWLINCPPSSSCMFKISLENNSNIFDITQGFITVNPVGPTIVISSPSGGENISSGSIYPITWSSYGINYVRLEYSLNGDTIFQLITPFTAANTGLYNWNVPANINATNCNIRISNAANTSLSVQTSSGFSIQSGQFYMISSNFTSILFAGDTLDILWSETYTSPYVNLDYSVDSVSWNTIESGYTNSGSYSWSIPFINADSVWIRVQDYYNNSIFDINDMHQTIVISDSLLELIGPADGSVLLGGDSYAVSWNSQGINNVDIEFSDDGGNSWSMVAGNVNANNGFYLWQVPNILTNNALLRIKNSSFPAQFSQNQAPFTISDYFINITSPNGGESFFTNSNQYITWETLGVDFVNLYFSEDDGLNYTLIDSNVYNLGYYNWAVSATTSNSCKIKIVDSNNQFLFDESGTTFNITNPQISLNLVSPNGGEQIFSGSGYHITWQASGITGIDISYSLDNGVTYIPIAVNYSSLPAYYFWYVPDTLSLTAKIKINASNNISLNDVSNSNFSIIDNTEELLLLTPNGNEQYNSFSYQTIKWKAVNVPYVKLYYSANGGANYTYINSVLNDSTYIWEVPSISSSVCKIKVENGNNPLVNDVSDLIFSIDNQPVSSNLIQIDSLPDTNFCIGAQVTIPYSITGTFSNQNNFRVHISDPFGSFSNFTDIGGTTGNNSGVIQCDIPTHLLTGNSYTLRIVSDNPVAVSSNYLYGSIRLTKANADFVSDKQLLVLPDVSVNFTPFANSNATSLSNWNTGDGGNYSSFAPQHQYSNIGKYDITHSITDTLGCTSQLTQLRYINVEHWFPNLILNSNSNGNIIDIAFENGKYGCALLNNGNCLVSNDSGFTWSMKYTNSGNDLLNSIHIFNNVWYITSESGTYYKSTDKGNTWIQNSFNNFEGLKDIYFISSNNALAAGNNGKLLKFNGSIWQNQNSGTNKKLNKIANNLSSSVVVGNEGVILKHTNNVWSNISSPLNVNYNSVCFKDSAIGFIACDFGFILKTADGGNTWNVVLSGADAHFRDIVCKNDTVWAIANIGIIYTSLNNGQTWNRYSVGTFDNLNSIIYHHQKGYIAGENGMIRTFNTPQFMPLVNSLGNDKNAFEINCFPNPTSDKIFIEIKNKNNASASISINDIQGRTLYKKSNLISDSNNQYTIDLKAYPEGVYFVSIENADAYKTFKIVKTK